MDNESLAIAVSKLEMASDSLNTTVSKLESTIDKIYTSVYKGEGGGYSIFTRLAVIEQDNRTIKNDLNNISKQTSEIKSIEKQAFGKMIYGIAIIISSIVFLGTVYMYDIGFVKWALEFIKH